jgi:O-acetylserine/cysteine efflux transporter
MAEVPRTQARAGLTLVGAAALWGMSGTATKYALSGFDPVTLLTIQLAFGAPVLWAVLLLRGYRPPLSWRRVLLLGGLEPALAYLGETLGLSRTTASNGAAITGMEAVFIVILAAFFLGERINRLTGTAIAVAVAGFVVLEGGGSLAGPGLGDFLVLAGTASAAVYTIVARSATDDADALTITAHQFAVALLVVLPIGAAEWLTGAERVPAGVPVKYWLVAAGVGIGGYAVSFLLYNRAILTTSAGAAAVIVNLIPAFGVASAVVWLGDRLTPARVVGVSLIGISVATFASIEFAGGGGAVDVDAIELSDPASGPAKRTIGDRRRPGAL